MNRAKSGVLDTISKAKPRGCELKGRVNPGKSRPTALEGPLSFGTLRSTNATAKNEGWHSLSSELGKRQELPGLHWPHPLK